jgi:2-polyprenyl-3-methyl-5-hydroxy-6-metoxy-1,4-benzoquinol methylase
MMNERGRGALACRSAAFRYEGLMGRFASTVSCYEGARPPYAGAFFAEAARELGFDRSHRLLDVGTAPGILAIGFAPYCREVMGVDPEPAMIEAACEAAVQAKVALELIEGRFEDLLDNAGLFDAVTIGRALPWLDPEPARRRLERVVKPHGRILICHASSVKDCRNAWLAAFNAVRERFGGERPRHDTSAFFAGRRLVKRGTIRVEASHSLPAGRLADRILSMSTSSPERLGEAVPEMKRTLRQALEPFAADGVLDEVVGSTSRRSPPRSRG